MSLFCVDGTKNPNLVGGQHTTADPLRSFEAYNSLIRCEV